MTEPTDKEFVEAWIYGVKNKTGVKRVAEALGMEYFAVSARASLMRRAKVALPSMPHPDQKHDRNDIDSKSLNDLIEKECGKQPDWRYH